MRRKLINENFFKSWSEEMAYILGYWFADGCITRRKDMKEGCSYLCQFGSKDKEQLEKIRDILDSNYKISQYTKKINNKNFINYSLHIRSKEIYEDILNLGGVERKSLIARFPYVPKEYIKHFIRGYFDGDGCITIKKGKGKYGQPILKGISIIFTSGSRLFLEGLRDQACKIAELGKRRVYRGSNAYYLKYDTFESLKWFKLFYSGSLSDLFLERKFNIFKKYFQLRPIRIDKEIENILKKEIRPSIQVV